MATYSFLDVNCSISGVGGNINLASGAGVAEEGISIEAVEDKSTMTIGADGSGMHSLHASTASKISIKLLKTSPTNQLLMNMYNQQTSSASNHGKNTITVSNQTIGETITITSVAFKKVPTMAYAKEAGMNEWLFDGIKTAHTLGNYGA
ncbi:MAG TPA: phage protein [Methanosarcina sp.]|nr:phage protein [Methanosarcina sp.]